MGFDQLISLISLALAVFFWWNARQQAASAERTLDQIKSQIIGWQDQLNKTAVEMLASKPPFRSPKARLASQARWLTSLRSWRYPMTLKRRRSLRPFLPTTPARFLSASALAWLQQMHAQISRVQANNSFKPNPLRGSA